LHARVSSGKLAQLVSDLKLPRSVNVPIKPAATGVAA
jgi:hypothetical protein